MLKISHEKSAFISLICTWIVIVLALAVAVFLPKLVEIYTCQGVFRTNEYIHILVWMYLLYIPAGIVLVSLIMLLGNIRKEEIFVKKNIPLFRALSWGCFLASLILLVLSQYTDFFTLNAVVVAFIGLILKVVKNVFEEAIILKDENDYTI